MPAPSIYKEQALRPEQRLIVALDVDSAETARRLVGELDGLVDTFKVGLQLFSTAGPAFVAELVESGKRIFLDLKFHDIPNTVAKAGIEAARLGVWMFNVHTMGGTEMMRRTAAEVAEFCTSSNRHKPHVIGVTVLTSADVSSLEEIGIDGTVPTQVGRLATLSAQCGLDGVVAAASEVAIIRSVVAKPEFLIVTPGIRSKNGTNDDQKRVMSPGSAVSHGSDHLVVGRPVLDAADRRIAVENILNEIRNVD